MGEAARAGRLRASKAARRRPDSNPGSFRVSADRAAKAANVARAANEAAPVALLAEAVADSHERSHRSSTADH